MRIFIKRYGYEVSNTTMHKYMNKELNLCAVIMHSKPGYKTGKKHKIFDNLLNQNFTVDCKNKVWCTDFTYMRQPNGKFRYNCSIIDLYDRSAVASLNSNYINTDLAIETLKKALEQEHYPEVILHSDQGVQFTSWDFVNFCKDNNVTQSMSKTGCPYDNAPMERFYNTFKSNFYNVTSFSSVEMMDELTMKYINWYNYVRPHSYNNYLTPMEARYSQIFIEQSVTKKLDQYIIVTGDTVITVEGVADVTAPNVEIKVKENGWTQFLDTITFGILFKETQDVTVTASDVNTGSGIDKVYYYISDKALSEDEVKALTSWTEYDKKFSITLDNTYAIYVKAVDKAGNETYASTDGMVLDGTSPIITGIEQNGVYYAEATFGATDTYLDKVLVDDEEITLTDGSYTIYADDKEHTIKATDKVGNEVSYTITVKYGVIKNYVTGYEGTYDGQTHSITVTVDESSDVKITYSTDEGETKTYSDEKPVFTEAGEYTVYYKLEKDNYTAVYGSETKR